MRNRYFDGLDEFAQFLTTARHRHESSLDQGTLLAAEVLKAHIVAIFGDASKLASLAPSTQDERAAAGYPPNEPLLRDGTLRSEVEIEVEGHEAVVGSRDPIQAYHEFGFFNVRAMTFVPPRPVFLIGAMEAEKDLERLTGDLVEFTFQDKPELTMPKAS